jgi:hypothetical protein
MRPRSLILRKIPFQLPFAVNSREEDLKRSVWAMDRLYYLSRSLGGMGLNSLRMRRSSRSQ